MYLHRLLGPAIAQTYVRIKALFIYLMLRKHRDSSFFGSIKVRFPPSNTHGLQIQHRVIYPIQAGLNLKK